MWEQVVLTWEQLVSVVGTLVSLVGTLVSLWELLALVSLWELGAISSCVVNFQSSTTSKICILTIPNLLGWIV